MNKHDPHFLFLQETKLETLNPKILKSILNEGALGFEVSPSHGLSGGLLSMWRKNFSELHEAKIDRHWIMLTGHIISLNLKCHIINLYNPCDVPSRSLVWNDLSLLCGSFEIPCLIAGDCNEILNASERRSQTISTNGASDFKAFLQVLHLIEIPSTNAKFIWFRGQSKSKLDRVFVHPQWLLSYPSM